MRPYAFGSRLLNILFPLSLYGRNASVLEYIVDGGIRYRDGVYCSVDNLGTENMIRTHAAHVLLLQHTEFVLVVRTVLL